jgi:hypothetical protein
MSAEEMQRELYLTKADMRSGGGGGGGKQALGEQRQSFVGRGPECGLRVDSGNIISLALYRGGRLRGRD